MGQQGSRKLNHTNETEIETAITDEGRALNSLLCSFISYRKFMMRSHFLIHFVNLNLLIVLQSRFLFAEKLLHIFIITCLLMESNIYFAYIKII